MEEFKRIAPTLTLSEMMKLWGVSDNTVVSRLKFAKVKAKTYSSYVAPSKEVIEQIFALYHKAVPYITIGQKVGLTERKIAGVLHRAIYRGTIKKRERISVHRFGEGRCTVCGFPHKGEELCGFCVDELPVIPEGDLSQLAIEVLATAILDAANGSGQRKDGANLWLMEDDFDWWNDMAGIDPEFTREKARKAGALETVRKRRV